MAELTCGDYARGCPDEDRKPMVMGTAEEPDLGRMRIILDFLAIEGYCRLWGA
ncbi:hypothetical protein [Sphaerisporangium aureirubrum]|uniref:Uncharacterized protein n=1 Tax=Sphaerisporangium aureirubrum TaxID=1544736 RepID=A0ABW1NUE6_9ACTN